ncbi:MULTISPECIES: glycerol kinase GlpK [Sphingomonadaceae]|uniref:Glycerol kinase n=1 Tax=Sphingomonas pseudosanguinis TaxID=413712 RepID=A0A7W6ADU9_9SPHN|nr:MULTISPECIES: glycerol kinase GlpK [Sphingomonadaceae]MBB3879880.1 glycerol kinase [Sphingomonas pseudosanguinis]MBN3536845.1 glycerol kinase GlpK [Sphingomonas pseudosanguinis]CAH0499220.1 Glycerol kinase [Novosphingobium sp. CECT 9465]
MAGPKHILAIDQGTTSTRAIVFDADAQPVATAQTEFAQHYPHPGWVEHDPEDIWRDALATARDAIAQSGVGAAGIAGIGITNQRETVVVWDRATGETIHNAIVWQDRRTADLCSRLKREGHEPAVRAKTGLLLDPYFSATKLAWILDHVDGARLRAERGELAFGTIDSFLLWRLTGGAVHATDVTNASRTLLYDIHAQHWDPELCALFDVPMALLPAVHDNSHIFGHTADGLFDAAIPVAGIAGDQQAALFGQACFETGMAKSTYGTGCFMLLNTGEQAVASGNRLLTTPAYRLNGRITYALEGSIFIAGGAVKWLRDGIGVITHARETNDMATQVPDSHGVFMVPAFVGLGAPHWDPDARGAIFGLTLGTTQAHLARAALEAVGYQTMDLADAMIADGGAPPAMIRVDGGMAANDWLCQFLADMLNVPVERPRHLETTALGAAFHAGLATGVWPDLDALARTWVRGDCFEPRMGPAARATLVAGWHAALAKTLTGPRA